jgi:hypothetical protein
MGTTVSNLVTTASGWWKTVAGMVRLLSGIEGAARLAGAGLRLPPEGGRRSFNA